MEEYNFEPNLHHHLADPADGCDICQAIAELREKLLDFNLWTAQSIEEDILPSLSEAELYEYLAVMRG